MTIQPLLEAPAKAARRGASGPTIILGVASIGGFLGLIAGIVVAAAAGWVLLPDDAGPLPFSMMVGAGIGWLIGAWLGSVLSQGARSPGTVGRTLVHIGVAVVVLGAALIAVWPLAARVSQGGLTYFSFWRADVGMLAFEITAMVDAAIVVSTFLFVLKRRDRQDAEVPGRIAGATGIAGLLLGGVVFAFSLWIVATTWSETVARQRDRAMTRTTSSLVDAVHRHERRTGSLPTNLGEMLGAGGKVFPGVQVEFAGVVDATFCVRIGTDTGEPQAGDPHYSFAVHRPPGEKEKGKASVDYREGNLC